MTDPLPFNWGNFISDDNLKIRLYAGISEYPELPEGNNIQVRTISREVNFVYPSTTTRLNSLLQENKEYDIVWTIQRCIEHGRNVHAHFIKKMSNKTAGYEKSVPSLSVMIKGKNRLYAGKSLEPQDTFKKSKNFCGLDNQQERLNKFVRCQICGIEKKSLGKHIRIHNISAKEYKIKYNAEIENEFSKQLRAFNRRNTIRNKYNVDNVSQVPEVKARIVDSTKKSTLKKFGVDNVFKLKNFQVLAKKNRDITFMKKYGTTQMIEVPEIKARMRKSIIALWKDPNSVFNSIEYGQNSKILPNKSEKFIINCNIPNLEYTGNFHFWVTFKNGKRKNPDFVLRPFHIYKKVIELKGLRWATEKQMIELIDSYKQIGIDCLVIWDRGINKSKKTDEMTKTLVQKFIQNPQRLYADIPKEIGIRYSPNFVEIQRTL